MTGATHQFPSVVTPNATVVTTEASAFPLADVSVVTTNSNSGDGPSIHDPGSNGQGRADDSARCSVVTGTPFEPAPPVSSRAPRLAGLASAGSALSSDRVADIDPELEAAIRALEISWLRAGIVMNAATLASIAASESFSNSTSTVGA